MYCTRWLACVFILAVGDFNIAVGNFNIVVDKVFCHYSIIGSGVVAEFNFFVCVGKIRNLERVYLPLMKKIKMNSFGQSSAA